MYSYLVQVHVQKGWDLWFPLVVTECCSLYLSSTEKFHGVHGQQFWSKFYTNQHCSTPSLQTIIRYHDDLNKNQYCKLHDYYPMLIRIRVRSYKSYEPKINNWPSHVITFTLCGKTLDVYGLSLNTYSLNLVQILS